MVRLLVEERAFRAAALQTGRADLKVRVPPYKQIEAGESFAELKPGS